MTTIVLDRYYGENAMQYEKRVDKLIAKGAYRGKGSDVRKRSSGLKRCTRLMEP